MTGPGMTGPGMTGPGMTGPGGTATPPADPEPVRVLRVASASPALADRLESSLIDAERARAARMRATSARVDFVVARAVLREQLGRVLGCAPDQVPLTTTSTGKPHLTGRSAPQVGVTHTAGLVLVAWHPTLPLGIDAEPTGRALGGVPAARVCTAGELAVLEALPVGSRSQLLLRLWVRKEAVGKADGRGLGLALAHVEVLGDGPIRLEPRVDDGGDGGRDCDGGDGGEGGGSAWVRDLDVGEKHLAALATLGRPASVSIEDWSPSGGS